MSEFEREHTDSYEPTLKYRDTLRALFDTLFDGVEARILTDTSIRLLKERYWVANDKVYIAGQDQTIGIDTYIKLLRLSVTPDDLLALRVYIYDPSDGTLQVANDLFTAEEADNFRNSVEARNAFADEITRGIEEGFYAPTDVEYMEFIEDADSFEQS
jgi:hypothetical protein